MGSIQDTPSCFSVGQLAQNYRGSCGIAEATLAVVVGSLYREEFGTSDAICEEGNRAEDIETRCFQRKPPKDQREPFVYFSEFCGKSLYTTWPSSSHRFFSSGLSGVAFSFGITETHRR